MVIMEFAPNGSLLSFLRGKRDIYEPDWTKTTNDPNKEFTLVDLVMISYQVSRGMAFLASRKASFFFFFTSFGICHAKLFCLSLQRGHSVFQELIGKVYELIELFLDLAWQPGAPPLSVISMLGNSSWFELWAPYKYHNERSQICSVKTILTSVINPSPVCAPRLGRKEHLGGWRLCNEDCRLWSC